jgi:pilus assembly protein CpaB
VKARRRRGLLLLSLAVASGGLAASQVRQREQRVESRVGPLVPVLVAVRDVPADSRIARGALAVRQMPARFVPPDALRSAADAAGARTAAPLVAGGYVTTSYLQGAHGTPDRGGGSLRPGERALEIAVGGGSALAAAAPGARVDVLVSSESQEGAGRTYVALEDVELLGLRGASGTAGFDQANEGHGSTADALATLRVTVRQAVFLTAAETFGRDIRLLVRPLGDRSRSAAAVSADQL